VSNDADGNREFALSVFDIVFAIREGKTIRVRFKNGESETLDFKDEKAAINALNLMPLGDK
jgi:hypothetical protein